MVGVGGVGSWTAEALARSGVAELTLFDLDHVAESNVNRQVQAIGSTLGMAKVEALRARIADIHPGCVVHAVEEFVDDDELAGAAAAGRSTSVVDACDQVRAKAAIAAWALATRRAAGRRSARPAASAAAERVEVDDLAAVDARSAARGVAPAVAQAPRRGAQRTDRHRLRVLARAA